MTGKNNDSENGKKSRLRLVVDNAANEESAYTKMARETSAKRLADWLENEHLRTEGRARRQKITVENCPADDVVLLAIDMLFGRGYTANYTVNERGPERRAFVWVARRSNFLA